MPPPVRESTPKLALDVLDHRPSLSDGFPELVTGNSKLLAPVAQLVVLVDVNARVGLP